jgi:hypothetical protein
MLELISNLNKFASSNELIDKLELNIGRIKTEYINLEFNKFKIKYYFDKYKYDNE